MTDTTDTDATTEAGAQVGETTQAIADAIKLDQSNVVTDNTIAGFSDTIAQASPEHAAELLAALEAMKASGRRY